VAAVKAVIDPNVLVSAAISRHGPPREILERWIYGEFEMVVSYDLLYELEAVLLRERFREKLSVSDVVEFVSFLADRATMVEQTDPHGYTAGIADQWDYYLRNLAEAAGVDRLVSGDPDLHATSPREFADELEEIHPRRSAR
jgi:putative PIN family toxin of toxin-antitoxin system